MASRASYSPISRQSISADDDTSTQTLLSHDESEKPFSFERPHRTLFQRRHSLACKSMLFLLVLAIHASLVILLAGWLAPKLQGSPTSSSTKATGLAGHDMDMEIHTGGDGNGDAYTPHFAQHNEHNDNDNDNAAAALAVSCIVPDLDREYTFEGIHPAVYKDPTAEFLMKDPCGSTPTEARARGCRYGMLYGSWLPDECWDEETEVNFKKVKDWRFWLQANRTEELSWEEVARGEHEYVLVEWEYHQRHCAEMNRRLFTAMSRRGIHTIDSYLSQWAHFHHCQNSLMQQKPMHELSAILWRKFPDCGVIRWKN